MDDTDKVTYSPFILWSRETRSSLILVDRDMLARSHIFEERPEGWLGNGYDWTSIARVVVDERLPDLKDDLNFDPEGGTFVAVGSIEAVRRLGEEMKKVFDDEASIRDILGRAELD
jgi:hypothetical protein